MYAAPATTSPALDEVSCSTQTYALVQGARGGRFARIGVATAALALLALGALTSSDLLLESQAAAADTPGLEDTGIDASSAELIDAVVVVRAPQG